MSAVLLETTDAVASITLNRPERLNAINKSLLVEFNDALAEVMSDDAVRVVVLRGAGSSFCSGDDLVELVEEPPNTATAQMFVGHLQNISRQIMLGPKTVVSVVHGWAIGGGAAWPLNADLAVWTDDARLRFPEAGHGLFPSGGATWLLPQFCGPHRAQEICLTGEVLARDDIEAAGIARDFVDADELDARVDALLQRLLSLPRGSLSRYKKARADAIRGQLEQALSLETRMMIQAMEALVANGALSQQIKLPSA